MRRRGARADAASTSVEFLLSANPGEAPKPLARVASGGELSRIMLALKALTAAIGETPILIFDEVDAGIGGTVADAVARRLKTLARNRQLLCITHLPQIAAYADSSLCGREAPAGRPHDHAARAPLAADERDRRGLAHARRQHCARRGGALRATAARRSAARAVSADVILDIAARHQPRTPPVVVAFPPRAWRQGGPGSEGGGDEGCSVEGRRAGDRRCARRRLRAQAADVDVTDNDRVWANFTREAAIVGDKHFWIELRGMKLMDDQCIKQKSATGRSSKARHSD